MVLICRLSPPPAPAVLLRSRAPLSLARHLPTLWGVILPEGAFKLKLIAKAATPQAASRPAPLEGEPGGPMTSIGPYSIGVEESRPRRGQYGEGPKSVKKNAVIPAFFSFWGFRPPHLFWVTKKVGLPEESHYKRVSPHGGDTPLPFIQKNQ